MNDKYIRIWKDMVAVYCKQFSQITFGVTKENKEGCEVGRNPADIRIQYLPSDNAIPNCLVSTDILLATRVGEMKSD